MQAILITGANGFIGKNLIATLRQTRPELNLLQYDVQNTLDDLQTFINAADFIIHLAGVNRPQNAEEFASGNIGLTEKLIEIITAADRAIPILLSSSIQADLDNPYGASKLRAEQAVMAYSVKSGAPAFIYRLPNVFGKWCRPNYNSAVATFCHNIANNLPITINDPAVVMNLVYIDDVVNEFIKALEGQANRAGLYCQVPVIHTIKLGEIAELINSFKCSRSDQAIPDMSDPLTKKMYSTYLSYLPSDQFSYSLKMNIDHRGSFTEFLKTPDHGQVSVNISKPGIVKGNHWHHTKNEKFLVVSGEGIIRFRQIDRSEVIEYPVNGDKLEVVDIPVGYTHNIENLGDTDLVTIMWANEAFDPENPDTYYLEV